MNIAKSSAMDTTGIRRTLGLLGDALNAGKSHIYVLNVTQDNAKPKIADYNHFDNLTMPNFGKFGRHDNRIWAKIVYVADDNQCLMRRS